MRYGMRIAALINLNASNNPEYSVSFRYRITKFLDHESSTAFRPAVAIS
jgi:hypothetical protein